MNELKCIIKPNDTSESYRFVVCVSKINGKYLLSRRRDRSTWETQGGHIEPGETCEQAARRELFEESGAVDYDIRYLCDYYGYDEISHSWGAVFSVDVRALGDMPVSEMAEVKAFDALPDNLTYRFVTPELFAERERNGD